MGACQRCRQFAQATQKAQEKGFLEQGLQEQGLEDQGFGEQGLKEQGQEPPLLLTDIAAH